MGMTKSEQIRAGLQKSFQSGTSAKASTVCYGYKITQSGELVIDSAEAKVVTFIFHQFMSGNSQRTRFEEGSRLLPYQHESTEPIGQFIYTKAML